MAAKARTSPPPAARYFRSPAAFRAWLVRHHASAPEVLVGYHRRSTGRPSMTWPESVDEALCFGWIDGIRRRVDEERYTIRFTPRKPRSNWSRINIARAEEMIRTGRMRPAGLAAFERREAARSGVYSFEQQQAPALPPASLRRFRANRAAWRFWQAAPAGYRRAASWWVISAKREDTRARRLETLIADSAAGLRIAPLRPAVKKRAAPSRRGS